MYLLKTIRLIVQEAHDNDTFVIYKVAPYLFDITLKGSKRPIYDWFRFNLAKFRDICQEFKLAVIQG